MRRIYPTAFILILALHSIIAADKLPKPDRVPAPATPEQKALIHEGVALHDQQNYEGAIAKYKQVLADNPWETTALHELGLSYFASKDYPKALETARLGAQCRTPGLAHFYVLMGNALDELGRGDEAIHIYKAAIKQNPDLALLHYNLAISLRRAGKQSDAKASVEKALHLDPNHPSSHLTLGGIYQDMGYRIPAILAYSRFLALEPESPRAQSLLPKLVGLLTGGVTQGDKPGNVNITLSAPSKDHLDEGDFMSAEMMLSITLAAETMAKPEEAKKLAKSQFEKLAAMYSSLGESLNLVKPKGGFAATYYAPYFAALSKAEHSDAYTAYAWKTGNVAGSADWVKANEPKLAAFVAWSKAYEWPSK